MWRYFTSVVFIITILPISFAAADEDHKGKKYFGPRMVLGAVYGASFGLAVQGEFIVADDIFDMGDTDTWLGLGGSFAYSSYTERFGFAGSFSEWKYTNLVFLGSAFFHFDIIEDSRWDTYSMLSLGINTGSVSLNDNNGFSDSSPTVGFFSFGLGLGARYAINDNLMAAAEAGLGFGALRLGLDFRL